MDKIIHSAAAVKIAASLAEARGFKAVGRSNISEAVYLERPGFEGQLRIAAHKCTHGADVVQNLLLYTNSDRFPPIFGYNVTGYTSADLEPILDDVINLFDSKTEKSQDC